MVNESPIQWVTLDGTDPRTGDLEVPLIAVWNDYNNRMAGTAGNLRHGTIVKLIRREGDGLLIETADGLTRGWITAHFTTEYKRDVSDNWAV